MRVRAATVVLLFGHCLAGGAQDLQIGHLEHFSENRAGEQGRVENRSLAFSDPYHPR